jgi:hypothetical protein
MSAVASSKEQAMLEPTSLTVHQDASGPFLQDGNGQRLQLYLPLADFIGYAPFAALTHPMVLHAPISGEGSGTPRLRVGETIYQRRRWEVDFGPLAQLQGIDLALEVWRMKRAQHWPRFVFARVVSERKPWLFDTASPFAHDLLKNMVREDAHVLLEEMLPGPDQLWLQDDKGQRYTSEIRMQVHRFTKVETGRQELDREMEGTDATINSRG